MSARSVIRTHFIVSCFAILTSPAFGQVLPGEGPRLGPLSERMTQAQVESGTLSLLELRKAGVKIFATPFNKADGIFPPTGRRHFISLNAKICAQHFGEVNVVLYN